MIDATNLHDEVGRPTVRDGVRWHIKKKYRRAFDGDPWVKALAEKTLLPSSPSFNDGLALLGPTGCGKTVVLVHLFGMLVDTMVANGSCDRASEMAMITPLELSIERRLGRSELFKRSLQASVLLLDDVEQDNMQEVHQIIHSRDADMLPTWITSTLAPEDLKEVYGSTTARRMLDGFVLEMMGK